MSKDPAFLFYSSDFLTGTMTLTNEQVGKYIRLLCLQHQTGHISEKDMLNICKTYDEDIFCKFIKDSAGKFFNQRLENETNKRKSYSESRAKNRLSKKHMSNISNTYVKHMENEIENEDINTNRNKTENKIPLVFPFSSDAFMTAWGELLKEPKWKRKTHRALQASLKTVSSYSEQEAIAMIEQAIAGAYQGLHPVSKKPNYGNKQFTPTNQLSDEQLLNALHRSNQTLSGDATNQSEGNKHTG